MYIVLNDVKKHLNIESTFTDDDNYLNSLIVVAETVVENHICRELSELEDEQHNIPKPLVHAMLLLIGHFYNNRESVTFGTPHELPLGYDYLLQPYQNYDNWG